MGEEVKQREGESRKRRRETKPKTLIPSPSPLKAMLGNISTQKNRPKYSSVDSFHQHKNPEKLNDSMLSSLDAFVLENESK